MTLGWRPAAAQAASEPRPWPLAACAAGSPSGRPLRPGALLPSLRHCCQQHSWNWNRRCSCCTLCNARAPGLRGAATLWAAGQHAWRRRPPRNAPGRPVSMGRRSCSSTAPSPPPCSPCSSDQRPCRTPPTDPHPQWFAWPFCSPWLWPAAPWRRGECGKAWSRAGSYKAHAPPSPTPVRRAPGLNTRPPRPQLLSERRRAPIGRQARRRAPALGG